METSHRRLNGRLAACNPCRARKVSCDHRQPVCTRCLKKKQPDSCIYSDTPSRRSKPSPSSRVAGPPLPAPVLTPATLRNSASSASPRLHTPLRTGVRLGHTSVLEETQSSLLLLGRSNTPSDNGGDDSSACGDRVRFRELPHILREMCFTVLRALPGQSNEQMTYLDGEVRTGWTYLAVDRIIHTLRSMFAQTQLLDEQQALEVVAQTLCANTARPFEQNYPDCDAFLDAFSGANLRWESIGLLWAHMERANDLLDALNKSLLVRSKNNTSVETARTNLDYCLKIIRHFCEGSVLLLDLMRRESTLDSLVDGELSLSSWETGAKAIGHLTFLGAQAEEPSPLYKPTFYSEYRRRMAIHIFTRDKLGVAFTGRPPYISSRYFTTPMPLDISDEALTNASSLERAMQDLDSNGWNMTGRLYPVTAIRARFLLAMIRDELFEATLGRAANVTVSHLLDVRNRECALQEAFPMGLKFQASDLTSDVNPGEVFIKTFTQLEHLQNLFFADRLLQRYNHPNNGELLVTSFTMVTLTLHFWMNQDRFSSPTMRRNFEWIVLSYGAPGAGILCQELLYPTFTGCHPLDNKVSRSSIIQQLSMLISFFNWVRSSAPNATLCCNCSVIIQRVLDHTLNGTAGLPGQGGLDWGVLDQPDFSFELMDTFDWMRAEIE